MFFQADDLVSSGLTFYNALPKLDPPKLKVDEVFTEFRVPLLKELPGAQELTMSLAARYADYNGATGGVLAYNGGLEWAPIEGLRLRAGLARAVRAPSLVDLYSEQSQNFADDRRSLLGAQHRRWARRRARRTAPPRASRPTTIT